MVRWSRVSLVFLAAASIACGGAEEPEQAPPLHPDSLSPEEVATLSPDPMRYPEMRDGRLDTIDMQGEAAGAMWHVQVVNYAESSIAITYAFTYNGPHDAAMFAADGQPRLVDDEGNVYEGVVVPENPRLEIENGAAGLGVYLFTPGLVAGATALTLHVNETTAPILIIGPWGVPHTPGDGNAGGAPPAERDGVGIQTGD